MRFPHKIRRIEDSQSVRGTSDTQTSAIQDASVDHRRSHIFVSEELQPSTDVVSILREDGWQTSEAHHPPLI